LYGKSGLLQAAARQRHCTGVEQIRGFDLSDITFVGGKTGWIVFAPLLKGSRS
jgi:alkyl sulfatase BDS1-like metallo-beta-lactamase superfamily hydrolase